MKIIQIANLNNQQPLTNAQKIQVALEAFFLAFFVKGNAPLLARGATSNPYPMNIGDELGNIAASCDFTETAIEHTSHSLLMITLGNCWNAAGAALYAKYGNNPKINPTPDISALRAVVGSARNAFAHDPAEPKWIFYNSPNSYYENLWTFTTNNGKITVDLRGKNDKILRPIDFGGFKNIFIIFKHTMESVK